MAHTPQSIDRSQWLPGSKDPALVYQLRGGAAMQRTVDCYDTVTVDVALGTDTLPGPTRPVIHTVDVTDPAVVGACSE